MQYNIFIEGIPGSGKTTLLNLLSTEYEQYWVFHEGEVSPVELAWCAYMSEDQYEQVLDQFPETVESVKRVSKKEGDHYIVPYTRIQTGITEFYSRMEQYEIYSGRITVSEFQDIVLRRYKNFVSTGNIFECAFFQNILEELMLYAEYSDEQILCFYQELIEELDLEAFRLIRLDVENIADCIDIIRKERVDDSGKQIWFDLMLQFVCNSPYGKANHVQGMEGIINHFERRIRLENHILNLLPNKCVIRVKSKGYRFEEIVEKITENYG